MLSINLPSLLPFASILDTLCDLVGAVFDATGQGSETIADRLAVLARDTGDCAANWTDIRGQLRRLAVIWRGLVSLRPRPAAPTTPPTVPRRPPTPFPRVDVTPVMPPWTPDFLSSPIVILILLELVRIGCALKEQVQGYLCFG